jgi:hypothetical protein
MLSRKKVVAGNVRLSFSQKIDSSDRFLPQAEDNLYYL